MSHTDTPLSLFIALPCCRLQACSRVYKSPQLARAVYSSLGCSHPKNQKSHCVRPTVFCAPTATTDDVHSSPPNLAHARLVSRLIININDMRALEAEGMQDLWRRYVSTPFLHMISCLELKCSGFPTSLAHSLARGLTLSLTHTLTSLVDDNADCCTLRSTRSMHSSRPSQKRLTR